MTPAKTYFNRRMQLNRALSHLNNIFKNAIVNYLSSIKEVVSCNTPANETKGKVCLEEIGWHYDDATDIVTITYSEFDKFGYGDLEDTKILEIQSSVLDKFMNEASNNYWKQFEV